MLENQVIYSIMGATTYRYYKNFFYSVNRKESAIENSTIKTISLIISGFLISCAIWQIRELLRKKQVLNADRQMARRTKVFFLHQNRRRIQINAMLGIVGVLMLIGMYIPIEDFPGYSAAVWFLVILFIFWIMLLAFIDYCSIRLHYSNMDRRYGAEQIQLRYELEKYRERARNKKKEEASDEEFPENDS